MPQNAVIITLTDHISRFYHSISFMKFSPLAIVIVISPFFSRSFIKYLELRRCHCNPITFQEASSYGILDTLSFAAEMVIMRILHLYGNESFGNLIVLHLFGQIIYWLIVTKDFKQCKGQSIQRRKAIKAIWKKYEQENPDIIDSTVILPCKTKFRFIFELNNFDFEKYQRKEYLEKRQLDLDSKNVATLRVNLDKNWAPNKIDPGN